MNTHYKSDKEPIELLLGLGGAVQYLEHTRKDDLNYSVLVKTKTGNKQVIIPIEAAQLIQSKKPTNEVIESIKRQLASEPVSDVVAPASQSTSSFWRWLPNPFRTRN